MTAQNYFFYPKLIYKAIFSPNLKLIICTFLKNAKTTVNYLPIQNRIWLYPN